MNRLENLAARSGSEEPRLEKLEMKKNLVGPMPSRLVRSDQKRSKLDHFWNAKKVLNSFHSFIFAL